MLSTRVQAGIRAGLLAATATGGAVIGFAGRHGDWPAPFVALGAQVLRGLGIANAPAPIAWGSGVVAHIAWMTLWGIVFAIPVLRKSLRIALAMALLVAAGSAWTARAWVPTALGAVNFAALPGPQYVLCLALITVGLVTGRALALSDPTIAGNRE